MRVGWLFGDGLADDVGRSSDVQAWAHQVAQKSDGSRAGIARALYEDLMERIPGAEGGFGAPASHILAAGRGNRAVLLKAGLDELGVPCHFAAVRTFDEDPSSFRFPSESRWGYVILVVEPDPGKRIWLDPRTRWAPFGTIADSAQGVPAIVLPGPGEEPEVVETSVDAGEKGRTDGLTASLAADGTLSGKGWEKFVGYDAAMARGALEQMDPDRRRQAVEQALARSFRNVEVGDLDVDLGKGVGADVTVHYSFKAPGFARDRGNGQLSVDLDFFAARLGRRYLNRGSRSTPLLLRDPERAASRVEISLPPGVSPSLPAAVRQKGKFGTYERTFQMTAGKLVMDERLDLARGRVAPDRYAEFAAFVQAVDQAQSGEVDLKPKG
jgi:hypothetical protein